MCNDMAASNHNQKHSKAYLIAGMLIKLASMCPDFFTLTFFCGGACLFPYYSHLSFLHVHTTFTPVHPSFLIDCILPFPGCLLLPGHATTTTPFPHAFLYALSSGFIYLCPCTPLKCKPSCTHLFCFDTLPSPTQVCLSPSHVAHVPC